LFSPKAIHYLIKYFNSIDKKLSNFLTHKQPWDEESLTRMFCDLLDKDYQEEFNIDYTLTQFYSDLSKFNESMTIDISLETHQYKRNYEHDVTKSDIGLILEYKEQFDNDKSFEVYLLLQAKRLFPIQNKYSIKSEFNSFNAVQYNEINKINEKAGFNFVSYLLYCPRTEKLEKSTREGLTYARNEMLGNEIFDYAFGQELRDDLLRNSETIASGIYVSEISKMPCNFYEIHKSNK